MVDAPPGTMTPSLRVELRGRKHEILRFLHSSQQLAKQHRAIVPLQPRGLRPPIFGVPGGNGDVFCFLYLAERLGTEQPLYGLQPPGLDGLSEPLDRIEELAAFFVRQITDFYPEGPLVITGFCVGGMTAFEVGRQLARVRPGVVIALLGAPHPTTYRWLALAPALLRGQWERFAGRTGMHRRALMSLSGRARWRYITELIRRRTNRGAVSAAPDPVLALRAQVESATFAAARRYTPSRFGGRLLLFVPSHVTAHNREKQLRWRSLATDPVVFYGPDRCTRDEMLHEPYVGIFADQLRDCAMRLDPAMASAV